MHYHRSYFSLIVAALLIVGCNEGASLKTQDLTEGTHEDHAHHEDHGHHEGHDGHDGHDHQAAEAPKTFSESITQLTELRDAVQSAMEQDDLKKADGPVHQIGHLLKQIDELASDAGLTESQQKEVKAAITTLFETFSSLDSTIHGKSDGQSWKDVSTDIDQAIVQLQKISNEASTTEASDQTKEEEQ
ncbi:hypothetical protein KOR42_51940 [Thalassoglobus neptunius]|uniref:Uncharacterized protein n=1 Tax=Thalassoglobus neptunius TaxID=1938619 RepID=A0A5C5VB88_9PLAN|nr:hypothetical protein [Thalassoglobus neptunius]TWT35099.1 hypothetical protein KOR42_51940 [Thalassoglobus neptunius]